MRKHSTDKETSYAYIYPDIQYYQYIIYIYTHIFILDYIRSVALQGHSVRAALESFCLRQTLSMRARDL